MITKAGYIAIHNRHTFEKTGVLSGFASLAVPTVVTGTVVPRMLFSNAKYIGHGDALGAKFVEDILRNANANNELGYTTRVLKGLSAPAAIASDRGIDVGDTLEKILNNLNLTMSKDVTREGVRQLNSKELRTLWKVLRGDWGNAMQDPVGRAGIKSFLGAYYGKFSDSIDNLIAEAINSGDSKVITELSKKLNDAGKIAKNSDVLGGIMRGARRHLLNKGFHEIGGRQVVPSQTPAINFFNNNTINEGLDAVNKITPDNVEKATRVLSSVFMPGGTIIDTATYLANKKYFDNLLQHVKQNFLGKNKILDTLINTADGAIRQRAGSESAALDGLKNKPQSIGKDIFNFMSRNVLDFTGTNIAQTGYNMGKKLSK